MRSEDGQSTIEYLAVVLLVAVVVGAAAALVVVTGLGERVTAAMRRALCVVTGEVCDEARRAAAVPCVTASDRHSESGSLQVTVVRVGEDEVLVRETRSDGSVALTLIGDQQLGLDVGTGVDARVRWGRRSFAVGRELRAAVLAQRGHGKTWIAPDAATADRLVQRVGLADTGFADKIRIPAPDVTYRESGASLSLDLLNGGSSGVQLSSRFAYGERIDHRTGRRTVYIRDTAEGRVKVSYARSVGHGGGAGASAGAEGTERYGVTFDRAGHPVDLVVVSTLDVDGTAGLPKRLSGIAGLLDVPSTGAKHIETEQHLDLGDPANAEAAQVFLTGLADTGAGIRIGVRALRDRLDQQGTLSVRTYAAAEDGRELAAHAKVGGVGGGFSVGESDESDRLVAAVARRPDGTWGPDAACLVA